VKQCFLVCPLPAVCARTRNRFRAFMHLSFKCFMCGMKDSLQSKTTPRNLVSSTTGTGVPFSRRVGSGWGFRNLQKCMHTVLEGENLNPLVSAQSESLLRHCSLGAPPRPNMLHFGVFFSIVNSEAL